MQNVVEEHPYSILKELQKDNITSIEVVVHFLQS